MGLAFAFDEAVATDVLLFHIGLQALIGFELLFEFEGLHLVVAAPFLGGVFDGLRGAMRYGVGISRFGEELGAKECEEED